MARPRRWKKLLDQLREEFERMEDALDDAEIVRLSEEVKRADR